MNGCENYKNVDEYNYEELKRIVLEKLQEVSKDMLSQNKKINEVSLHIKDQLCVSLVKLLDSMKLSGELSDIISDVLFVDIVNSIEKTNVYYDGISTDKLYDESSKTYYYVTNIPRYTNEGELIPLKMGIANDDLTCSTLESTLKHAWRKNATICVNCGIYNVDTNRPVGSVIYNGEILYRDIPTVTPEKYQYFAITKNNEYKVYPIGTTPESMIKDGVNYACPIFNSLIIDGVPVVQTDLRSEPRQSIGIKANGDIVIVSCDGRSSESIGMSYDDLARIHALNGSINAYILDGGGSTSTVLRGVKQNENIDNYTTDRSVGTFLYVAKATNTSVENNIGNDLGRVKQFLIGQVRSKTDFPLGRLALRAPEGQLYPTMQMMVNGEDTTRCRFTYSYDPNNSRNTYAYIGIMGPEDSAMKTNLFRIFPQGVWVQTYHGPSSTRPNGAVGLCYFDETIGKPIWYNGSKWVDSTGTEV